MIGQLCLDAYLPELWNLYTHCEPYHTEGVDPRVSTFNFIFIYNYFNSILQYELSTIFTIYSVYIYISA